MNVKVGRYHFLALCLIVIALAILFFDRIRQNAVFPSTLGNYDDTGSFKIDPRTILQSIDQGKTNIFMPVPLNSDANETFLPSGSFSWTQSDYLKIAAALYEFLWKEPIDNWDIYYLSFDSECQNNLAGFDMAEIIFFRVNNLEYDLREININPLAGEVAWGAEARFPRPIFGKWNNVNLSEISITADQAFQIAEENGGREQRLKNKNECDILVRIPNSNNDGRWDVSYYSPLFEILINPYTGEYNIPDASQ